MMKLKFFILLFLPLFCNAQTKGTIIEELTRKTSWGGIVTIKSNPQINALIGKPSDEIDEVSVKMQGFRIQAFAGNQQRSRTEAEAIAREIKGLFPEVSTDIMYRAPTWRLRVGDFRTNEEATIFMRELKKKLPSSGREMYVVPDEIKVIL